jgi:hypothetical protein
MVLETNGPNIRLDEVTFTNCTTVASGNHYRKRVATSTAPILALEFRMRHL